MNDEQQNSPLPQAETGSGDRAIGNHKNSPLPQAGEGPGVRAVGNMKHSPSPTGPGMRPYLQVALTYLHHLQSMAMTGCLIIAGIVLLFGLIVAAMIFYSDESPEILVMLETYLFIMISVHIKEQFAAPRSRLTPNFRRIHASVAGLFAFFFAVLLPAVLTLTTGSLSIGLVALMVCVFSVTFWCVLLNVTTFVIILACFSPYIMTNMADSIFGPLLSGRYEPQAFLALLAGVIAVVAGGMRLLRMNEEVRGYRSDLFSEKNENDAGESTTDTQTCRPGLFASLYDRQITMLTRHARRGAASRWSAVCRWQVGTFAGWIGVVRMISSIIIFLLIILVMNIGRDATNVGDYIPVLTLISTLILPWLNLTQITQQRKHTMCYELLLPEVRKAYFKQLGAATAMCQFQMWLMMIVLFIISNYTLFREPWTTAGVVSIVILSGLFQIFIFGANALLALQVGSEFAIVMVIVAGVPLLLAWAVSRPLAEWQYGSIGVMAFFAAFGLLLAHAAYRRWLAVDIA